LFSVQLSEQQKFKIIFKNISPNVRDVENKKLLDTVYTANTAVDAAGGLQVLHMERISTCAGMGAGIAGSSKVERKPYYTTRRARSHHCATAIQR